MKRLFFILFPLFFLCGCASFDENMQKDENAPVFSIEEAQRIFEKQYSETLAKTKSDEMLGSRLSPGDFTPQWGRGEYSSNNTKTGYDIPILADRIHSSIRVSYYGNEAKAYSVDIHQRLIVMRDNESGVEFSYIITLIPDKNISSKSLDNFSSFSINKGSFSGLVVYTIPGTDALVRVSKYKEGRKVDGVFIPSGENTYLQRIKKRLLY